MSELKSIYQVSKETGIPKTTLMNRCKAYGIESNGKVAHIN